VAYDELDVIEAYGGEGPGEPNAGDTYMITPHCWNQGEAGKVHGWKIRQIVADISTLLRFKTRLGDDLLGDRQLVIDPLSDHFNAQLRRPNSHDVRRTAGDHSEAIPGSVPKLDPQSVANVEVFRLDSLVVEYDAAVRQHAVDVGQDQFDSLGAGFNFHVICPLSVVRCPLYASVTVRQS
jgi:hypothetical protein